MKFSRRSFLLIFTCCASSLIFERRVGAQAGPVLESDANAQALGYKMDASKVDKVKYPNHQAGQACGSCQFFQGKTGDAAAPCTIFGGKQVNARGWCSAYVKKA
jgi:High potential iron-sulfur protein